jgi:hypothetical protein
LCGRRLWKEETVLIGEQTSCIVADKDTGGSDDFVVAQPSHVQEKDSDETPQGSSTTVEWSEEELELISAKSFVFGRCIKPFIMALVHQTVMVHCPRAVLIALPILGHPLRVVSTRLRCHGVWSTMSTWECFYHTLKSETYPGAFTGIVPRMFSQLLVDSFRLLRIEEKIRAMMKKRRTAEGRRAWQLEQCERLCAGLIDTVLTTTITYPFCVLEVSSFCVFPWLIQFLCLRNNPHSPAMQEGA